MALGAAVVVVGLLVLYIGAGGLGVVANTLGGTITSFVEGVTATPTPSTTPQTVAEAPSIESLTEPYTNENEVDLSVTVPSRLAGDLDYVVRVYLASKDQSPTPIDEKPLAATPRMIIPVRLTKGINDFSVTLVGPGGESGIVAAGPLGPRQESAGDQARVAEGRRQDQPQSRHPPGADAGSLDAQCPEREDRRVDRWDRGIRRHLLR